MRSALRLSRGDLKGAHADTQRIAGLEDSPYLEAISRRYEKAIHDQKSLGSVDLTGLPHPAKQHDWFVAGFHELRNRRVETALEFLTKSKDTGFLAARDLRLLALLAVAERRRNSEEREALLKEAIAESHELERVYGEPTARTRGTIGLALAMLRLYEDSIAPLLESNRLRGGRFGTLQNLGVAYRRLRNYDEAEKYLKRALAVRPEMWRPHSELAIVYSEQGKIAQALHHAGLANPRNQPWAQEDLKGTIYLFPAIIAKAQGADFRKRAERARADGDQVAAREHTERADARIAEAQVYAVAAQDGFRRALDVLAQQRKTSRRIKGSLAFAEVLVAEDEEAAWRQYLVWAQQSRRTELLDPLLIHNLAQLLPEEDLTAETAKALKGFLSRLSKAKALAPQVNRVPRIQVTGKDG